MSSSIIALLKKKGLRDTQQRRMVLASLERAHHPLSPYDLQKEIAATGSAINAVTVYRVLALFESMRLVHRHPCNGRFSLCTIPDEDGHHGFLHCTSCGAVEEFHNASLCKLEDKIAKSARFSAQSHVSEIVGVCASCTH